MNKRNIAYVVDEKGYIINTIVSSKNTDKNTIQLEHNMIKPCWDFKKKKWNECETEEEMKKRLNQVISSKLLMLKNICSSEILKEAPMHKQINAILFKTSEKDKKPIKNHIEKMKKQYSKLKEEISECHSLEMLSKIDDNYIRNFLNEE